MFSRQCVKSKVFSHLGFKTWRCRKNSGRGLILSLRHCFAFSCRLEMYTMSSNAAALHMQTDRCMTLSKHRESYREQTRRMLSNRSRGALMSYAIVCCAVLLQVEHTYTFCLCWNKNGNFSPPPLRKSKIIKYKSILRKTNRFLNRFEKNCDS